MTGRQSFHRWDAERGRSVWDAEACAATKAARTCQECGSSIAHMRAHAKWCGDACARKNRVKTPPGKASDVQTLRYRLRRYGLSIETFEELLARQDASCAICHEKFDPSPTHTGVHVDHDHATGAVRGLLCTQCNVGIGMLGDDVDRIMSAAAYLLSRRDMLAPGFA